MQSIEILDGKIVAHYSSSELPLPRKGGEVKEIDDLTNGAVVGTLVSQIDETGRLLDSEELEANGTLTKGENETIVYEDGSYVVKADYTSKHYWKKETGIPIEFQIGDTPDDTMTDVEKTDGQAVWKNGAWVLENDVLAERIREERSRILADTDHMILPDVPIKNKDGILRYRQELRDITLQETFPRSIEWPVRPQGGQYDIS